MAEPGLQIISILGVMAYPFGRGILGIWPGATWARHLGGPIGAAVVPAACAGWFIIGTAKSIIHQRQITETLTESDPEAVAELKVLAAVYSDRGIRSVETAIMLIIGFVVSMFAEKKAI